MFEKRKLFSIGLGPPLSPHHPQDEAAEEIPLFRNSEISLSPTENCARNSWLSYAPAGRTRPGRHRPGAWPRTSANICEHLRRSARRAPSSACSMRTKDLVGPPWARQSLAAVLRGLAPRSPSRARITGGSHHRGLASRGARVSDLGSLALAACDLGGERLQALDPKMTKVVEPGVDFP